MSQRYFERIEFEGDLETLLADIASAFSLGKYSSHKLIEVGYEDFSLRLNTANGSYFLKIFAASRSLTECKHYVRIIEAVLNAGVRHPALLTAQNKSIYTPKNTKLNVVVMEWLDGETFFDSQRRLTDKEAAELIKQAATINKMNLDVELVYDSWAISSMIKEFDKWRDSFSSEDLSMVAPVIQAYRALDIQSLPHSFVHGDLIRTNVMPTANGLYVFDFAVANQYPRIQELAVLLCDMLFVPDDEEESKRLYDLAVREYQKHIKLTDQEIETLPLFVKAAHTMHIVGATRENEQGQGDEENEFWWNLGRAGLAMSIYDQV